MRIVLTNLPPDKGKEIARQLIHERLAACINILPVRSMYRWEGEVCDDPEETLLIKVSATGVDALRAKLEELHPYDLPEIVVLHVDTNASLASYVQWVREESQA